MYFAVICDIVHSKQLPDREKVQAQLKTILKKINQEYSQELASNFTITLGDEAQGLLHNSRFLLEIIDKIRFSMEPVSLRFGVGIGEILTPIRKELSIGADGPAYWSAREAIEYIHEYNDYQVSKILIKSSTPLPSITLINDSLHLSDFIVNRWTDGQKELLRQILLNSGYQLTISQTEIARELHVTTQTINQRIQAMGYYQYIRSRIHISEFLAKEFD